MENNKEHNLDTNINDDSEKVVQGETFIMHSEPNSDNTSKEESYTMGNNVNGNGGNNMSQHYNDPNYNGTYYVNPEKINVKSARKRGGAFKRVMSYVLVGIVCTTIGGVASGFATLYVLPKTGLFQETGLYRSEAQNVNYVAPVYDNNTTIPLSDKAGLTVAEIAKKVGPAVVAVTTMSNVPDVWGNPTQTQSVGSGMIINADGYILTNYHVVEGATSVKIKLSTGKEVNGKVVNYDQNYDVAVVKITDNNVKVPAFVELGDSNTLQVGESVVAIGNPLGTDFFGSVTTGVISALSRKIDGDPNGLSYLQTDAAINSGNSGGPLINSRGQVVGINTAKIKESGVEGLGFAIPIDSIKDKIATLSRPILMIGISGREITEDAAKQYNWPVGVLVSDVMEYSPAERAGLKPGDIIIKLNGQKIKTFDDINKIKNKHKVGDTLEVVVNRYGKEKTLELKLTE